MGISVGEHSGILQVAAGGEKDLFRTNVSWIDQFPLIIIELRDWLLPGLSNSKNFLSAISERNFDVIYRRENLFCFNNDLLSNC